MPNIKKKRLNPKGYERAMKNRIKKLEKHIKKHPNDKKQGLFSKLKQCREGTHTK